MALALSTKVCACVERGAFEVFVFEDLFVELAGAGRETACRRSDEVGGRIGGDDGSFVADG